MHFAQWHLCFGRTPRVFIHYGARARELCQGCAGITWPAVVLFELSPRICNCRAETWVALKSWLHLFRDGLFLFGFFFATFSCSVSLLTSWVFWELSHEMCLPAVWRLLGHCPLIWLSARLWGAHHSAKWLFMSQVVWHGQGQDVAEQLYWALPSIYRIMGIFLLCTVL